MICVYISYANEENENWERVRVIPLVPYRDLYPNEKIQSDDVFGLLREPLELPNGEVLLLGVAFWEANNSISFIIEKGEETLLNVGAYKPKLDTFDPSIVVKTPGGLDVSFMFSNSHA